MVAAHFLALRASLEELLVCSGQRQPLQFRDVGFGLNAQVVSIPSMPGNISGYSCYTSNRTGARTWVVRIEGGSFSETSKKAQGALALQAEVYCQLKSCYLWWPHHGKKPTGFSVCLRLYICIMYVSIYRHVCLDK